MTVMEKRPVGLTQDGTWQVGVRRTMAAELEAAWEFLTGSDGLALWLGAMDGRLPEEGGRFQLPDGTSGEVRVLKPQSHLRVTWQPPAWKRPSTIQVRTLAHDAGCTVAFHQEHMPSEAARRDRAAAFRAALQAIERNLAGHGA